MIRGTFAIEEGQTSVEILNPLINQHTILLHCAENFTATKMDLTSRSEQGRMVITPTARADGYAQVGRTSFTQNMPSDVPIKVTDYNYELSNSRIDVDVVNGIWTPRYGGHYLLSVVMGWIAPNNSSFTLYFSRNESFQPDDIIKESVSIQGQQQNLEMTFGFVSENWMPKDTMSIWLERHGQTGDVTIGYIRCLTVQIIVRDPMPPLRVCRFKYVLI